MKTFTNIGSLEFHQPGLNIHRTAFETDELLVQGNPGGQVLLSTDGGGSFAPLCPRPDPVLQGSGVGMLHDGTLLAAVNQEDVLGKKLTVARTTIHRAKITRAAGSGNGAIFQWPRSVSQPKLRTAANSDSESLLRLLIHTCSDGVHLGE